jgi:hypothetical protein
MERRGLITRLYRAGFHDYELNATGRAVAEKLRSGAAAAMEGGTQ